MPKSPLNMSNDPVLMSIMATKPVHAPRNKKAAGTQAEPVSAEALHASANVFQNTMAMLLARNMPATASQPPTPPPTEAAPASAPASRHPRDRRLFADYAWEWFESYKVPKLRPGTEMNYRLIIRKHLVPFFGDMRLDEINTVDVQRFYNQHAHKAKSSVRCMSIILHGIFDSAIEDGLCVIDPTRSKRLTYSKKKTVREALPVEAAQDIICNLGKLYDIVAPEIVLGTDFEEGCLDGDILNHWFSPSNYFLFKRSPTAPPGWVSANCSLTKPVSSMRAVCKASNTDARATKLEVDWELYLSVSRSTRMGITMSAP